MNAESAVPPTPRAGMSERLGFVSKDVNVFWAGPGLARYHTRLRQGLPVRWLSGIRGRWVLEEFPADLFPRRSPELRAATNFGLTVPPEYVDEAGSKEGDSR